MVPPGWLRWQAHFIKQSVLLTCTNPSVGCYTRIWPSPQRGMFCDTLLNRIPILGAGHHLTTFRPYVYNIFLEYTLVFACISSALFLRTCTFRPHFLPSTQYECYKNTRQGSFLRQSHFMRQHTSIYTVHFCCTNVICKLTLLYVKC